MKKLACLGHLFCRTIVYEVAVSSERNVTKDLPMPVSSVRDTCFIFFSIIALVCLFNQPAEADDIPLLNKISPHISLQQNELGQTSHSFSLNTPLPDHNFLNKAEGLTSSPLKSIGEHDLFSLALGARFQISEWIGIGAAWSMPLKEEETVSTEDLTIEAMVTMQF